MFFCFLPVPLFFYALFLRYLHIKFELLKLSTQLNHFALKSKLYLQALQSAYAASRELNPVRLGV
jgi:hypothetical protein